ncbi:DUF2788 domain-containing protein [Curvibacter sp. APW13]|uniref:DUF2788 domain-containing protein n=1 Tax=Curvibacter sp. APW13 TaxID=3077236 RepID=UPI0028DE2047|nr:DUF2788 domain-containing protein [Curvibacter sp. APW13]MDT8990346.1 DUF2788 domain-containing protein [Curvibacter sp. APW13]
MFGFTEEQIAGFGMSFGLAAFMLYMLFIIGNLAWKNKVGKFGTFVMFLGLSFGMVGFVAKILIQWWLERGH